MTARDDELAMLGVLEASLGDRQRATRGLHVDEGTVRRTLSEMLAIERRIDAQALTDGDGPDARHPRHRKPARVDAAFVAATLLFAAALVFVLWQV